MNVPPAPDQDALPAHCINVSNDFGRSMTMMTSTTMSSPTLAVSVATIYQVWPNTKFSNIVFRSLAEISEWNGWTTRAHSGRSSGKFLSSQLMNHIAFSIVSMAIIVRVNSLEMRYAKSTKSSPVVGFLVK